MIQNKSKYKQHDIYYFTVAWNGYNEETEGSVTYTRGTLEEALEGIRHYLKHYKARSPYVAGLSLERGDFSQNLLNDKLKNKLEKEYNGK